MGDHPRPAQRRAAERRCRGVRRRSRGWINSPRHPTRTDRRGAACTSWKTRSSPSPARRVASGERRPDSQPPRRPPRAGRSGRARGVETVVDDVRAIGAKADGHRLDVADPASVVAFIETTVTAHDRIDGLVCSAGTTTSSPALELSLEDWQRILAVNLTGTFVAVQAAAREMGVLAAPAASSSPSRRPWRRRVNATAPTTWCVEGGVIALSKTFAIECGVAGVRVNNVAPGATESPLLRRTVTDQFLEEWIARNPLGRLGRPEDQANAICFLLSDAAEWITARRSTSTAARSCPRRTRERRPGGRSTHGGARQTAAIHR